MKINSRLLKKITQAKVWTIFSILYSFGKIYLNAQPFQVVCIWKEPMLADFYISQMNLTYGAYYVFLSKVLKRVQTSNEWFVCFMKELSTLQKESQWEELCDVSDQRSQPLWTETQFCKTWWVLNLPDEPGQKSHFLMKVKAKHPIAKPKNDSVVGLWMQWQQVNPRASSSPNRLIYFLRVIQFSIISILF